jgi:polynucleotide 5'-kinase involved in rRNA processing
MHNSNSFSKHDQNKENSKSSRKTDYNWDETVVEENDHQNVKVNKERRRHLCYSYIKHIDEKQTVCYILWSLSNSTF